jgi:hypothetical protein
MSPRLSQSFRRAALSHGAPLQRPHVRGAFDGRGDKLPTKDLIEHLVAIEERTWGGRPARPSLRLARLLAVFQVIPVNRKMPSGAVPKGYRREYFEAGS